MTKLKKCQDSLLNLLWIKCEDLAIGIHNIQVIKNTSWCTIWTLLVWCPTWYILSGWACIKDTAPTGSANVNVNWRAWSPITPVTISACWNLQWQNITYSIIWTLPTGITFDPNTRTFSGTYSWSCPATSSVIMRCTDPSGLYWDTNVVFQFSCALPWLVSGLQSTNWSGGAYTCGNPTITWTPTANTTYYQFIEWYTILATNITWTSYTVSWASNWLHTYTIQPCNPSGCNTGTNITVNIQPCNQNPVSPWNQTFSITEWNAVNITVNACTDPDWNPLTYNMSWLPSGLSFDPNTREITGTYTGTCPTTINATMTCSDWTSSVNTSIVFNISCIPWKIYVSRSWNWAIIELDSNTLWIINTYNIGGNPNRSACDSNYIYATNLTNNLLRINKTSWVVNSLSLWWWIIQSFDVFIDWSYWYVMWFFSWEIYKVDLNTFTVVSSIDIGWLNDVSQLHVSWNYIYVSWLTWLLNKIDKNTMTLSSTLSLWWQPNEIYITWWNIYVNKASTQELVRVSESSFTITWTLSGVNMITITSNGNILYWTNIVWQNVYRIDMSSFSPLPSYNVPWAWLLHWISIDSWYIYVSDKPNMIVHKIDMSNWNLISSSSSLSSQIDNITIC